MKHLHVMVDIETLGTHPGAAIFSIGAVTFDPVARTVLQTFYTEMKPDGDLDASTIAFWLKQNEEARMQAISAIEEGVSLGRGLHQFGEWIRAQHPGEDRSVVRLWGNGATFDNVLLDAAYRQAGKDAPWRYSGHRCFRTLVSLVGEKLPVERQGVHHNGLDDALYQTEVLFEAMTRLGLSDLH